MAVSEGEADTHTHTRPLCSLPGKSRKRMREGGPLSPKGGLLSSLPPSMSVFIATVVADCGKFLALFELSWNERGQRENEMEGETMDLGRSWGDIDGNSSG